VGDFQETSTTRYSLVINLAGEVKISAKVKLVSFNKTDIFCMTSRCRKITFLKRDSAFGMLNLELRL